MVPPRFSRGQLVAALLVAGALVACRRGAQPGGAATLSDLRIDAQDGTPVVHVTIALERVPGGDASAPYLQLGADQFKDGLRTVSWAELMALDDDPSTTAQTPPTPGQRFTAHVPVALFDSIETRHWPNYDLVVNFFWGTDAEGTLHQARALGSTEALYKRDVGR